MPNVRKKVISSRTDATNLCLFVLVLFIQLKRTFKHQDNDMFIIRQRWIGLFDRNCILNEYKNDKTYLYLYIALVNP